MSVMYVVEDAHGNRIGTFHGPVPTVGADLDVRDNAGNVTTYTVAVVKFQARTDTGAGRAHVTVK